jgi:hypothetical protein
MAAVGVALAAVALLSAANTGPIRQLKIDPAAEIVPLFDGMADGRFDVRVSVQDAYGANVFITNTTAAPLNAALPKAAVAVHVLPQFNPLNPGFFGQGNGLIQQGFPGQPGLYGGQNQNQTGALNAVSNLAQSVGGPFGPAGILNTGNGNGNQPFGFPSIPPEWADRKVLEQYQGFAAVPVGKTVQLQMRTVCLNYGRPDPNPGLSYVLTSVEKHSSDPALWQLLENYSPRTDQKVMQAAAWHLASGLSWDQLARLPDSRLRGTGARLFNVRQVQTAERLVTALEQQMASDNPPRSLATAERAR